MRKQSFNKDWTFSKCDGGWTEGMGSAGSSNTVTLPHDAMILETRDANNPSGPAGGYFKEGSYEYSKILHISAEDKGKTFILHFEGVYNRAWIKVNGTLAASIQSGYDELQVDITPYLNYGCDNQILVKVINSDVPNSRWYTGSGIIRPVSLYVGGPIRINLDGVRIETPLVGKQISSVKVKTDIVYDGKTKETVTLKTELIDNDDQVVAQQETPATLAAEAATVVTQTLYIKEPKLWSIDEPDLYRYRVTISKAGELIDISEGEFGIRKFEVDPLYGLRLNGEKILLRGGCIHHDNGIIGAATFDSAEERRIRILKDAGFNSVRISHNSSSRALLKACDHMGMLVMEESFDMWTQSKSKYDHALNFPETWEGEVERIVKKDYNHPSVFMYSIGNEIQEISTPDGALLGRKIAEKFRESDPSRFVTDAINCITGLQEKLPIVMMELGYITQEQLMQMFSGSDAASNSGNINDLITAMMSMMNGISAHPSVEELYKEHYETLDIIGMNYMRGAYSLQHDNNPNRIFYGSETFSPDIDLNWKQVKEIPTCIGDYCWTAWDYLGEAGIGVTEYNGVHQFQKPYPVYLANCGDVDITGFRRPISYYREIVFGLRKKPYIAVQLPEYYGVEAQCTPWNTREVIASWTWKGHEGKMCAVEVYSDAPEVELLLNGKSFGCKPAGEENRFKAVFELEYQPGILEAVSHYPDGSTSSETLTTSGDTARIAINADKTAMKEDELVYLSFELVDEKGIVNTCDTRKIEVSVSGEGTLQGYGSADYQSEENFFDSERTPYYGRTVAAVRADAKAGVIHVTAQVEGLDPALIEIGVNE